MRGMLPWTELGIHIITMEVRGSFHLHSPVGSQYGEYGEKDEGGNRQGFHGTGSVAAVRAAREDAGTVLALIANVLHKVAVIAQMLGRAIPFRSDTAYDDGCVASIGGSRERGVVTI